MHFLFFFRFLFPLQLYILSPITVNFFALLVKCYTFLKVHLLSGQGGVRYIPPYTVCIGRHTHNTDQGSKERCRGSSIKFASSTTQLIATKQGSLHRYVSPQTDIITETKNGKAANNGCFRKLAYCFNPVNQFYFKLISHSKQSQLSVRLQCFTE